jgi:hypothetical protein
MTDDRWWQKLTLPLASWVKYFNSSARKGLKIANIKMTQILSVTLEL